MDPLINNETLVNLLSDLGVDTSYSSHSLRSLAAADSKYLKDMKLNVSSMLRSNNMTRKEALLIALSIAVNEKNEVLINAFEGLSQKEGATVEEIAETHGCASLMSLNNVFYRFRHWMPEVEFYNKQPAGLRMSIMMNPAMGKGLFELMSLALSAVNGCEKCVVSHERSVRDHGADEPRIYDAVRLAATIKGLCTAF
jgi:alkyl hydroperoxide reductase subunit D